MKRFLTHTGQFFLHFLFPRTCLACSADLPYHANGYLCTSCQEKLAVPAPLICQRCGKVLKSGGAHCFACRGSKGKQYKCQIIRSSYIFNTASRALVHALKYRGADYVARFMAHQMALRYKELPELDGVDIVVPVPLFKARYKKRGYNQSELLARHFANACLLGFSAEVLCRVRDTPSQTHLNRAERLANMQDAFACVKPEFIRRKTVLLIDDVATTGATLEGCAAALKKAGAKRVFAYTFARE